MDNATIPYSLIYPCLEKRVCIIVSTKVKEETLNYYFRRDDHDASVPMKKVECYKVSPAYLGDVYKLLNKRMTFPFFQAHLDKMNVINFYVEGWINYRTGSMVTKEEKERAYRKALNTYYEVYNKELLNNQKFSQQVADSV